MEKLIVTPLHIQAAHICLRPGAQSFFKRHGFDFRDFMRNGIDAEKLIATGDAMALAVVDIARKEASEKNG
jgi:hypothetical protein